MDGGTKITFSCTLCDKMLKSKDSLKYHMKTHRGKKVTCAYNVTIHAYLQAFSNNIAKHTLEKSHIPAQCVTKHFHELVV